MVSLREGLMLQAGGVISLVGAGGKTSLMYRLARELSMAGETVLTTTTTKIFEPSSDKSACVVLSESVTNILERAGELLDQHLHVTAAVRKIPDTGKLLGFRPEIIAEFRAAGTFQWIIVEADGAAGRPLKAPAAHEPVTPDCTDLQIGIFGLNAVGRPLTDRLVFRDELFAELTGLVPGAAISEGAVADVVVHKNGIFKDTPAGAMRIAFFNQADIGENLEAGRRIARILSLRKSTGLSRAVIGQVICEPPILEVHDMNNRAV
jgi:probable selenium-dependent hydroxylase accessory protein YqeC